MAKSLLDLPQELRDMIYEYALTEDDGLVVQRWPAMHLKAAGATYRTDPNQLKFTCRQLYAETTGLSLRYNELIFDDCASFDTFDEFTGTYCTSAHFERVKRVVIVQERYCKMHQELKRAHGIGEAYPALSVEIRCDWLAERTDFWTWFTGGTEIQYALCDTFLGVAAPWIMSMVQSSRQTLGYRWIVNPRSFQIYPAGFDEESLRLFAMEMHLGDIEGGLDDWVAQCKKWFQEGF